MNAHIFDNMVMRVLIAIAVVFMILNTTAIFAQPDAMEFDKSSNNKKGSIVGEVSIGGIAAYGAKVQLIDSASRKLQLSVKADASGRFSFDEVALGNYVINISAFSYFDRQIIVSVKEGMNEIEKQFLDAPPMIGHSIRRSPELEIILEKFPLITSRYRVLTVCEALKLKPVQLLNNLQAIIIGNLV